MEEFVKSNSPSMSEDITALAQALCDAKPFPKVEKKGYNSHLGTHYSLLDDIYEAVTLNLKNNNIIVAHYQTPATDKFPLVYTRLIHTKTGQYLQDCRLVESEKIGNQGKGSAATYMKRYALLDLCAIAPGEMEDDDAQAEQDDIKEKQSNNDCIDVTQLQDIIKLMQSYGNMSFLVSSVLKHNKIQEISELKVCDYQRAKEFIIKNGK